MAVSLCKACERGFAGFIVGFLQSNHRPFAVPCTEAAAGFVGHPHDPGIRDPDRLCLRPSHFLSSAVVEWLLERRVSIGTALCLLLRSSARGGADRRRQSMARP